jgi:hypothetical protein
VNQESSVQQLKLFLWFGNGLVGMLVESSGGLAN